MPKTGMAGFNHVCNTDRVRFQDYKIAIKDSEYTEQEKTIIWDFYVTHNIAGQTSLQVTLSDYGWNMGKNIKEKSLVEIEEGLMKIAGIDKLCCIRSKKINLTLTACDLNDEKICVQHPRIVLRQKFSLTSDENENISFAGGGENRIDCLFDHIRNSLAHSNTYFFENGNILLEDKYGETITARILISRRTLLQWIYYIDRQHHYYPELIMNNNKTDSKNSKI